MDNEEGIEIESISLNSKKSIIKNDKNINNKGIKNLYKFILLNRIFITLIIISFLIIGILSMFININKKNSDFTEKDVLKVSTLIFNVLLIINGILWNMITYFILVHILNVQLYNHYITIKDMCIVFLGSGNLFDIFQYLLNCWNNTNIRNKIIIILCIIINIVILILHTFQNIFFDYQIYVKLNDFIDRGEMLIPDVNLISPQGANEILLLGNTLYFNNMFDISNYDAVIYNNKYIIV